MGKDYTLFATATGTVKFSHATKSKKRVSIVADAGAATAAAAASA
jgi:ribosomal protein L27